MNLSALRLHKWVYRPEICQVLRFCSTSSSVMGRLSGKTAVVTASTEGIGYAIARRLAQDGAHVVVSSRKAQNVDKAVTALRGEDLAVSGMVCHVGKAEDRRNLIEQTVSSQGGIDILVSNAAVNPAFGSVLDCSEEVWDKIFDTNVKATFLLCKDAVPHIEKRGGGSIIIVSSIGGLQPFNLIGAYSISKTALLGMTKVLAYDCGPKNIRVNTICPGIIKTKFSEALWKNPDASNESLKNIILGRLGESEDVAGLASFLASEDSAYITAENITVTGGMPSRL